MQVNDTQETIEQAVEGLADEFKLFGVKRLYRAVGFKFDGGLNQLIMEHLRNGETVAVMKIYEPRDLPENQTVGDQAKRFIN